MPWPALWTVTHRPQLRQGRTTNALAKGAGHSSSHSQPGPSAEPHSSFVQTTFLEEGTRSALMDVRRGRNPCYEDPQECQREGVVTLSLGCPGLCELHGVVTPQPIQSAEHTDLSPHFRISTSDSGAGNKLAQFALTPYPFQLLHFLLTPPPVFYTQEDVSWV